MLFSIVIAVSLMTGPPAVDQTSQRQSWSGSKTAVQQSEQVRAKWIDTDRFFPQIDRSLNSRPITIEHPELEQKSARGPGLPFTSGITNLPGPTPELNFPGLSQNGFYPGDPDIAVGPSLIVQVVNSEIGFFDKTSGALLFQQHANTFFAPVRQTSQLVDPKVIYDPLAERFVMLFHETNFSTISNFLFAVSDDSDPSGTWYLYRFDTLFNIGGLDHWTDFACVGGGPDGYVISANRWTVSFQFRGSSFVTIPKTAVLNGQPVTPSVMHETGTYRLRVAITEDPSVHEVFAAYRTSSTKIKLYAFSDVGTSSPSLVTRILSVAPVQFPPSTVPSGSFARLDTHGWSLMKAAWRNGRLFVSSSALVGTNMAGTYWAEFDLHDWPTSGSPTLAQQGMVSSTSKNYFMSSIGANKHGDVSMIFTGSNNSTVSDLFVVTRASGDPLGTVSSPVLVGVATGTGQSNNRWGDYFDVNIDPVDGETFWGTGMVVNSSNLWDTRIVSWKVSSTSFVAPTSFSFLRGLQLGGNVASLAQDDGDYLVAKAWITLSQSEAPIQLVAEATAPSGQVLDLELTVVAKVGTVGLSQSIQLWNYVTGDYDTFTTQSSTTSDSMHIVSPPGGFADYVEPGTRKVKAKVNWFQTGIALYWPWDISVDQVEWAIRTR